jgi:hypothetical protein
MADGFELYNSGSDLRIVYSGRTVLDTAGNLINLLPSAYDISQTFNCVFPDFTKDYVYTWSWINDYTSLGNSVAQDSACSSSVAIPKQDFEQVTNIVAAPTGADVFVGRVRLNRTSSPSHTWGGSTIQPLQKMNEWIPFVSGSLLMEAELGMARAMSMYVSGGQLVLNREQSVSNPPGGFGSWGGPAYNWVSPADGSGGENVYGSAQGIPVAQIDNQNVSPNIYSPANSPLVPSYDTRTRLGGSNACSISLAGYNYGSTYQVELVGAFGRRS